MVNVHNNGVYNALPGLDRAVGDGDGAIPRYTEYRPNARAAPLVTPPVTSVSPNAPIRCFISLRRLQKNVSY